jgi:hypothetical protein
VAYFLLNFDGDREDARAHLRAKRWPVAVDEEHRDALAAGDVALVYVAADRAFIARVDLASGVRDGEASEVALADVEWWDPPALMDAVLSAIGPSETAKGEFDTGVLWITDGEYDAAVGVRRGGGGGESIDGPGQHVS